MSADSPRTVVHFSDSDAFGGTERALLQLVAGLDRARWRPVVFHADVPGATQLAADSAALGACTVAVERGASPVRGVASIPGLVRALRREKADVFHAHQTWSLSCRYGIVAAALARVPARVASAQLFVEMPRLLAVDAQHALISRCLHRHIAVSQHVAGRLRDRLGVPGAKITVIPNAVEPRAPASRDDAIRAQLGVREGRALALTVARLEAQKGLTHLLDAAALLPDVVFAVAGEGPERDRLAAKAAALGLSDRVRWLGHRDDVPSLLAAADLFVLPSLNEGLPLAAMEAMLAGAPVVAADAGGTGEIVRNGLTGLLVPPSDPRALADAIRA
ncbi:MAG TPA: glycosyltransferase, partial [Gemmatimonadaceae bacterium]|nr:glycosyltransferase [Gemmatimonadaceae bacterium]